MLQLPPNQVTAVILGIMQDGGLPHAGCPCARCTSAFADPSRAEYVVCLGLVDNRGKETATSAALSASVYLFDATPDIKYQLNLLAEVLGEHPARPEAASGSPSRLRPPDGIFLTHAHLGHIGGLPQLGPEAMAVSQLPIYASRELGQLLLENALWRPLVNNLRIVPLVAGQSVDLAADVSVTAVPVPHRDEWGAGTFAFLIQGPNRRLLYLPDIDDWGQWPEAEAVLSNVDVALVDASFYSRDELGGRAPVAHPLIPDTLARFAHLPTQLVLTHLNHTNPVLDEGSVARTAVSQSGVHIAFTGQQFPL
ncbi:MAG: MBL fold metallo-hydrolase [Anaerolineae bacterium]|nr:MBL fold metallo-hydrolase [Anaerolineae bacterium]